jgi:dipeptidyl-peptidase-4
LGEFEVNDHIEAVKYLRTLPDVDGGRIGIWGWSYGGYTTCMCLLKGNEYFKLGVAVAPVTDWLNYDTIYTERYMDQPTDNPEGYQSSSAVKLASQLKGKLLLIHGSADDNVHLSNTMQLAYELQKAGKVFEMLIYPQKEHGISGVRQQLYESMTNFIMKNL